MSSIELWQRTNDRSSMLEQRSRQLPVRLTIMCMLDGPSWTRVFLFLGTLEHHTALKRCAY